MKIKKAAWAEPGPGTPTAEQLRGVNLQSKGELTAEAVYVFSVRLCDDQVDRDNERFDTGALPELGRMFLGKPGIVDHNWSAEKQVARIFDTEVRQEDGVSCLMGWAYIPRAGREQLISDIESGIRREVSISCSMGKRLCSICGQEMGTCGHRAGEEYGGEICTAVLTEPKDAYEFSFVAVPAQPLAGVQKQWKGGERMDLKAMVEKAESGEIRREYEDMKALAEYGRACREADELETLRMAAALNLGLSREALEPVVKALDHKSLGAMKRELSAKMAETFIPQPQLFGPEESQEAYLI